MYFDGLLRNCNYHSCFLLKDTFIIITKQFLSLNQFHLCYPNYANIMSTALKKFFYTKSNIAWSLNENIISINLYDEIVKLQDCFFVKCLCKMCQNACAYYTQWNDDGVVSIVKWDMILRTCLLLSCNMSSVIDAMLRICF